MTTERTGKGDVAKRAALRAALAAGIADLYLSTSFATLREELDP